MSPCPRCQKPLSIPPGSCPSCGFSADARVEAARDPFLGRTLGDFYIRSPLGEGGFARVYLADQQSMRRRAVVKILKPILASNPAVVERFRQEALLASKLSHIGIAQIYSQGETEEKLPYFAMEYVAGRPLSKILRAETQIEPKRAARLLALLAEAVDAAHEAGVIHRDLKPDNIMVIPRNPLPGDPPGSFEGIKILDFGIAKEEGASGGGAQAGEVFGSPHYMSPEQANGERVERGSDLYSLGVIAFEMLTGQVPFTAASPGQILLLHITTPPPKLEEVTGTRFPAALEGVIARALSKHPAQRHGSAREFAAAVAHAVDARIPLSLKQESRAIEPPRPSPEKEEPEARDRGFQKAPLFLGVGLVMLVPVVVYFLYRPQAPTEPQSAPASASTQSASAQAPKPKTRPKEKIVRSAPSPGVSLPPGASQAQVPPPPGAGRKIEPGRAVEVRGGAFTPAAGGAVELRDFSLDAYEVTYEDYRRCVAARRCQESEQYLGFRGAKHPIVGITFEDAEDYCAWVGKRLPTEAEWERAARGDDARRYPWGDEASCERANYGGATSAKDCRDKNPAHVADVGAYPDGASPYGAHDMAGNVWEWVSDIYAEAPASASAPAAPEAPGEDAPRVIRGGGWKDDAAGITTAARRGQNPFLRSPEVGFRCAEDAE